MRFRQGRSTEAGLASTMVTTEPPTQEVPPARPRRNRLRRGLTAFSSELLGLALLGAMVGLAFVGSVWLLNGLDVVLLLWLPGVLAVRASGISVPTLRAFPIYVVGASLAVLMAVALAVNSLGPGLGARHPLERLPLLCGLTAVCLVLIGIAAWRADEPLIAYVPRLYRLRLTTMAMALLPLLAVVGAVLMTNAHGPRIAVATVAATGATLLVGAYGADRIDYGRCMALIYFTSLALIWSFAMRGRFVYGSDILAEYHVFTGTLADHRWLIHPHNTAYGAMMSLTTLPTILSVVSGASPLVLLKAVYPALLAFFPMALFCLTARFTSRRYAYIAALIIVVQSYLFEEMSSIARQEIALIFFICLVGVLSDGKLVRAQRLLWTAAFGLGMVLSHYGTTYFAIIILAGAVAVDILLRIVPRVTPVGTARCAFALAVVAVGAFVWYVPVTHSTSNLSGVVNVLRTQGLSVLPGGKGHGVVGAYVSGNAPQRVRGQDLQKFAAADYHAHHPFIQPLRQGSNPAYAVQDAHSPTTPVKSARALHAVTLVATVVSQLINLLAVVACVVLLLRFRERREVRLMALFGLATLGLLAVIRVSGTLASSYNQERAFLQAMVPLAPGIGWLAAWFGRRNRVLRLAPAVFPVLLLGFFLNSSGLAGVALGGGAPANVSSTGEESARFVVTEPELAAGRWVVTAAGQRILYADRYGQLRITAATGRTGGILTDVFPMTLTRDAWILADQNNTVSGTARAQDGNYYSIYRWPSKYLADYWDQVYTNGYSAAYARDT